MPGNAGDWASHPWHREVLAVILNRNYDQVFLHGLPSFFWRHLSKEHWARALRLNGTLAMLRLRLAGGSGAACLASITAVSDVAGLAG
eukprot:CAMPEP_0197676630 /NCGR_PEP_ID=MMETSP1338-20131121/87140_1 /TAXON_ID=43686 ORGANISM="Pelagodinium beii, Strain RCC1491" /NCGR_SAMPLE_ID=MMETSP1338 /ASSEMBLY_ACC=CAM_ASM_000754 /LENGTH=87 /DNA_ID=CAMNT_0043257341 /DNA_START=27 /DNA_END=288 /DNA_ORIENTATION=+